MTPQPPDSWAGLGPRGGAGLLRSRQSARGLEVTRAASPGMGGLPFSGLLCAPPEATAASSPASPRRDTYRGRAAPRGRAGRRRRGATSSGPWPRRERGAAEGAAADDDPAPCLVWVTSNSGLPWRPAVSAKALGPGSAIQGQFEGRGRPRRRRRHPRAGGGGRSSRREEPSPPGWCPLQALRGQGGAARAGRAPRPPASRDCPEPSAGSPRRAVQLEPELARGCRCPAPAPVFAGWVGGSHG